MKAALTRFVWAVLAKALPDAPQILSRRTHDQNMHARRNQLIELKIKTGSVESIADIADSEQIEEQVTSYIRGQAAYVRHLDHLLSKLEDRRLQRHYKKLRNEAVDDLETVYVLAKEFFLLDSLESYLNEKSSWTEPQTAKP
jgi:hypothetical protein